MWRPPGQKPSPSSWSYDFQGGWGIGAGQDDGMQFEMAPGMSPGPDAQDPSLTVHPPGVMAPLDQTQYTPATGEFHPPGMQAPVDQENLTLSSPDAPQPAPGPDDVDPAYAATALRRAAIGQTISPLRQAQEMMNLLGLGDAPGSASGSGVGSGQDVGVGASPTQLGASTSPTTSSGTTLAPSLSQYNPGTQQGAGDDGLGNAPPSVQSVPGGYVMIDPATGEVKFFDTTGQQQKSPYVSVGDGTLFNTETGQFIQNPNSKAAAQAQAPTALGSGYYWNPATGKIEQVPQSTQPNNQVHDNGDGTYTVIDVNTGKPVSTGGTKTPAKHNVSALQQPDGTYILVDENGQQVNQVGSPKNEPINPLQTPTGDIVTWDPDTGSYTKAYKEDQYVLNDGSIVQIQPDQSLKYIYKGKHQFTMPDGSIVEEDPETGQYTMPFTMPEEQAPGWEVRGIQKMFPGAFTDESLVGPDFTATHRGGAPWKPDVPGPARGSMGGGASGASGSSGFSQGGLDGLLGGLGLHQAGGAPYDPNTTLMDGGRGPGSFKGQMPPDGSGESWGLPPDFMQFQQAALAWNPFAQKGVGQGQDIGSPAVGGQQNAQWQVGDTDGGYIFLGYDSDGNQQWANLGEVATGSVNDQGASHYAQPNQDISGDPPMFNPFMPLDPSQIEDRRGQPGSGQDVGVGKIVPPIDPSQVVGTGHRYGEAVSMEGSHMGVDLQAYKGTDTRSPVDGVVSAIKNEPQGLGLQVVIRDRAGTEHTLAHLNSVSVQEGDVVHAGDDVAQVGESGAGATGPHLDYRQQDAMGNPLDPTAQLGALAQMPRADDGSEPMPTGVGGGWWNPDGVHSGQFPEWAPYGADPSDAYTGPDASGGSTEPGFSPEGPYVVPLIPPEGLNRRPLPVGHGQDVGVGNEYTPIDFGNRYSYGGGSYGGGGYSGDGGSYTPSQLTNYLPWVQLQQLTQQNQRQYQLDQEKIYQDWLFHQDDNQYRQDTLAAQQKFQQGQLKLQQQQQTLGPYMQAAFNNPWLTRLSGQTPAWGQVGGPGGPWAARLGADAKMKQALAGAGVKWPDHFPGWGEPDRRGKLGLSVPIAAQGQVQDDFDPLGYGRMSDQSFTQRAIDRAKGGGHGRPADFTPPPNAPAGSDQAFKWLPTTGRGNTPTSGKKPFYEAAQGGVTKKNVLKGNVDWNVYAEMSPYQRAALRSDLNMNEKNFGDWTTDLRENWGKTGGPTEMPGMTMMHAMSQDPTQREGTGQLADTFGETSDQYYQDQQKKWKQAFAPGVLQSA